MIPALIRGTIVQNDRISILRRIDLSLRAWKKADCRLPSGRFLELEGAMLRLLVTKSKSGFKQTLKRVLAH